MEKATVSIYKGTGKKSGKPFTALKIDVGEWSTLHFPESRFEMAYLEKVLGSPAPAQPRTAENTIDLDEPTQPTNPGMFD